MQVPGWHRALWGLYQPPGWGGCRRWGPGSGNAQHLGVWGDVGTAPPGSVSTLPGAVSWVQRGQAGAGVQGFILSFLGAPRLWQPTLPLSMNLHSLSRIQRVQGWLEKGAVPPQCPWAEPAGPCSALPKPTFGLWGGSITPGLVWSLQGPAVTTGLTQSWNPAGIARAGDVRKWGLCWSMRAGGGANPHGERCLVSSCAEVLVLHSLARSPRAPVPRARCGARTAPVSRSCPLPSLEPSLVCSRL